MFTPQRKRRARGDLAQRRLEGVAPERGDADARLRDERRVVRPGDRLPAGAADRHAFDAAGEAGVEVRLDDADGERRGPPRRPRGAMRTGAPRDVSPRSDGLGLDALRVDHAHAPDDGRPGQALPLVRAGRRVQAAADGDGDGVVRHAGAGRARPAARSSTGSLGHGREASGTVTTTERAPRASSRRRGAPTGAASASRSAAPRSSRGSSAAGGSKASARGTATRRAPHQTHGAAVTAPPSPRRPRARSRPARRRPRGASPVARSTT